MSKWLRHGDRVVVTAGNDKGKTGVIVARDTAKNRVTVEGVNVRKKCMRPTQENQKGGIIELERPINFSNVRPCDDKGKPVRLKIRLGDKGEKELIYLNGDKEVVYRSLRKGKR